MNEKSTILKEKVYYYTDNRLAEVIKTPFYIAQIIFRKLKKKIVVVYDRLLLFKSGTAMDKLAPTSLTRLTFYWYSFYDDGLSFISENLSERESLKWYHLTPFQLLLSPRYCPFRLEYWQESYHQAPVHRTAQLLLLSLSLSLSFVLNAMLL